MTRALTLLFALLTLLTAAPARAGDRAPVILISLDGFRADYLDRGLTPTLDAMARDGAWAPRGMRPSFPTNTFPNHYTLVTGLRPDRHGVVDNTMYDPARPGVKFGMSVRDQVEDRFWWDGGEPIWVAANRAGLRTATMFWPGSEAPVRGVHPDVWMPYDKSVTPFAKVDTALGWLDLPPGERPDFMTIYFPTIDTIGHDYGPDSPAMEWGLRGIDATLARLVAGLKARGLYDKVNIVIVADHGMAPTSAARTVWLDDLTPGDSFRWTTLGSTAGLTPKDAASEARLVGRHDHFECWRKAELPARFAFGKHPRVPPVFCMADTGWRITVRSSDREAKPGAHGFDPADPLMAALFVARGPDIRRGARLAPFDNVSVYPLLARLLGVAPAENDGRLSDTAAALR